MLSISPISNYNFKSRMNKKNHNSIMPEAKKMSNGAKAGIVAGSLAGLTAAILAVRKLSVTSFEKALEKSGVEIKKGIAYVKETGKKFTGSIERNSKPFWKEKQVVKYSDGVLTEELWYGKKGKELKGYFYKDEILFRKAQVTKGLSGKPFVVYYEYEKIAGKKGSSRVTWTGTLTADEPFFEKMRGEIKEGERYKGFALID